VLGRGFSCLPARSQEVYCLSMSLCQDVKGVITEVSEKPAQLLISLSDYNELYMLIYIIKCLFVDLRFASLKYRICADECAQCRE